MVRIRRTGPGGANEVKVGKLRDLAFQAAADLLEEELAVGSEVIDLSAALLRGRCCRYLGPGEVAEADPDWDEWWDDAVGDNPIPGKLRVPLPLSLCRVPRDPLPKVLDGSGGTKIVPSLDEEYVRLEGFRWANMWARGRGSILCLDLFGVRGEAVLTPEFCSVVQLDNHAYIENEAEAGQTHSSDWLCPALTKLCAKVRASRKLSLAELLQAVEEYPSITLVVPAGQLVLKDPPSSKEFARAAARRHPMYVSSVEMGAKLCVSIVPPAATASGELCKLDAEKLDSELGAQLFELAGERGRLCVRREGGPPLDPAQLSGATLDDICRYLTLGWLETLHAAPSTWSLIHVTTERCSYLEASLGRVPGSGTFRVDLGLRDSPRTCEVCAQGPAIGLEVVQVLAHDGRAEEASTAVCRDCAAFVAGSPYFRGKGALSQHISRPVHEIVGASDAGLDVILAAGTSSSVKDSADGVAVRPTAAISGPFALASDVVPIGTAVLAVAGMLSLRPPLAGWGSLTCDSSLLEKRLKNELLIVTGCDTDCLHIVSTQQETGTPNMLLCFVLFHPAILHAGRADPPESTLASRHPLTPLEQFNGLEASLVSMAQKHDEGAKLGRRRNDNMTPLLLVSSQERVLMPCSLILLRPQSGHPPFAFRYNEKPKPKKAHSGKEGLQTLLANITGPKPIGEVQKMSAYNKKRTEEQLFDSIVAASDFSDKPKSPLIQSQVANGLRDEIQAAPAAPPSSGVLEIASAAGTTEIAHAQEADEGKLAFGESPAPALSNTADEGPGGVTIQTEHGQSEDVQAGVEEPLQAATDVDLRKDMDERADPARAESANRENEADEVIYGVLGQNAGEASDLLANGHVPGTDDRCEVPINTMGQEDKDDAVSSSFSFAEGRGGVEGEGDPYSADQDKRTGADGNEAGWPSGQLNAGNANTQTADHGDTPATRKTVEAEDEEEPFAQQLTQAAFVSPDAGGADEGHDRDELERCGMTGMDVDPGELARWGQEGDFGEREVRGLQPDEAGESGEDASSQVHITAAENVEQAGGPEIIQGTGAVTQVDGPSEGGQGELQEAKAEEGSGENSADTADRGSSSPAGAGDQRGSTAENYSGREEGDAFVGLGTSAAADLSSACGRMEVQERSSPEVAPADTIAAADARQAGGFQCYSYTG
ncbi:unnamed protein product [Polarella glacialis]|uniref:Uncharacterized protein n=1 Tax=Polarella glacialis TaxID=89957 RepID=A0A813HV41_POLGL|nr:unnamed protein product [Polarella glacialis]